MSNVNTNINDENKHIDLPNNMNNMNNSNILSLYMDQTINNALIKEIRQITKKFDIKNLISIIFLMGIDNIKKYINTLILDLPKQIYEFMKYIYNNLYKKSKYLLKTDEINVDDISKNIDSNLYSIFISDCFNQLLLEYIVMNKNSMKLNDKTLQKSIISKNRFLIKSKLDNIIINYKEYDIYLLDIIYYNYEVLDKDIKNIVLSESVNFPDELMLFKKLTNALELDHEKQLHICSELNKFMSYSDCGHASSPDFNSSRFLLKIFPNNMSLERIKKIIIINGKTFNGMHSYVFQNLNISNNEKINTIILVVSLYLQFYMEFMYVVSKHDKIFGYQIPDVMIDSNNFSPSFKKLYKTLFSVAANRSNIMNMLLKKKDNKTYFSSVIKKSAKNEYTLNMYIKKDDMFLNNTESSLIFDEFTYYLFNKYNKNDSDDEINVYNIDIGYKEMIIQEYEPSKIIEKKLTDGMIEKISVPEKLKEVSKNIYANMKKINTIYKDFSTLYLKESDEFKLKSMLDTFSKKKELYRNIGIPFKFNCILYGSPGTGKTSAVKAISSYLHRDIYYLDISKIKTNKELSKIFNDINENTNDGGVIVMEDIDAMSDIVLDRSLRTSFNEINSDDVEDKLTLSHLLNILDGTLSRDDMIFIATTNYIDKLDKALIRPGRFDICIHLSECDRYQYHIIYKNIIKRDLSSELLDRLEPAKLTPAKFIYSIIQYIGSDINDNEIISSILDQ